MRLVSEVAVHGFTTGAVQVHLGGRFGAVCSNGFGAADAVVVCRQLGFTGPSAVLPDPFGLTGKVGKPPRLSGPSPEALQVCRSPHNGGDRWTHPCAAASHCGLVMLLTWRCMRAWFEKQ